MKSNTCSIRGNGKGRETVLREVEKLAAYCNMPAKEALHVRLLTEELMGLLYGITGNYEAEFYAEEENGKVSLHLYSDMNLSLQEREQLKSVATSGKNEASKGILGKIRSIFEECLMNYESAGNFCADNGIINMGMMSMGTDSWHPYIWSLQQYRGGVKQQAEQYQEDWDELEKSIIANLADDVTVGINNKKAEVVVTMHWEHGKKS